MFHSSLGCCIDSKQVLLSGLQGNCWRSFLEPVQLCRSSCIPSLVALGYSYRVCQSEDSCPVGLTALCGCLWRRDNCLLACARQSRNDWRTPQPVFKCNTFSPCTCLLSGCKDAQIVSDICSPQPLSTCTHTRAYSLMAVVNGSMKSLKVCRVGPASPQGSNQASRHTATMQPSKTHQNTNPMVIFK